MLKEVLFAVRLIQPTAVSSVILLCFFVFNFFWFLFCSRTLVGKKSCFVLVGGEPDLFLAVVLFLFSLVLLRFVSFCFLFCFVLFCFVLLRFVLCCFVLFCFNLFCFNLFCFNLFCFVLFCYVLPGILFFSCNISTW